MQNCDNELPLFCDPCTRYITYSTWSELLQERGLTTFAGVSERHVRLAFAASQGHMLDEPLTHPPGLLLDEFCEAIARIAYSMLLTAEERAAKNKQRLRWVGTRRKTGNSGSNGAATETEVCISEDRIVSALKTTIRILCEDENVGDN
jgi:hypothetical protein